jgi:hypothetical protein
MQCTSNMSEEERGRNNPEGYFVEQFEGIRILFHFCKIRTKYKNAHF